MLRYAPPLAWAALIFAASSVPGSSLPTAGIPHLDKVVHAVAYAILAFLLARAVRARSREALGLAVAIVVLYGVSDEFHQRITPGRNPDFWDVVSDAVGAAAGAWGYARYSSAQTRAKP